MGNIHPIESIYLRFEEQLNYALQRQNSDQVQNLITEFEQFVENHLYLRQWLSYARFYMANRKGQPYNEAIHQLSDLQAQIDLAPRLRGRVLNALGVIYEMNDQWDRALRSYQECIAICEVEQDELRLGITLYNLAILHWKAQDYIAAVDCTRRSINLLGCHPESEEWEIHHGIAWNTYGFSQLRRGDLQEAQHAFEYALAYCQRYDNPYDAGIVHNNLGHVYRNLNELEEADYHYQQACTLTLATENLRETAEAMYGRCLVKLRTSTSPPEIQQLFDEALRFATDTNNHEVITDLLLSRATWYEQQGNVEGALSETQNAVDTVESLRANIMLPDDRARMTATRVQAYEQLVERLCQQKTVQNYTKAFRTMELAKSRTFVETLGKRTLRAPQRVPAEWLQRKTEIRESLNALYQENTPNPATYNVSVQDQIATLETELNHLRERIRLQDAEFESFDTVEPLSLDAIQAYLPTEGLLLEYFTIADEIWVFVVTTQSVQVLRLPLRVSELALAFKRVGIATYGPLRNLTRDTDHTLRTPWILHNLYQRLIEPIGKVVDDAEYLCIVPHGLLHYVPFHALYRKTANGDKYLNEKAGEPRPIVYAPSSTLLFGYCQQKPHSTQTGCLAIGHNNHSLSHAELEAETITQMMGGRSYVGSQATRSKLFAEASHYRYVHLSCHGWFNPTWPLSSSITMADGNIDVTDIFQHLQLNAELVCLSACETGRSYILQGDELVGLTRAFLYAGTPSVVVSQWVVDELSTRLFMENFYRELISSQASFGKTALALSRTQHYLRHLPQEALWETITQYAKNEVDAKGQFDFLRQTNHDQGNHCLLAHPYYWASFFLIGERIYPT